MLLKNGGTFREMPPSQRRIAQRLGRESRYHAHQKVAVAKPLEVPLLSAGEPRSRGPRQGDASHLRGSPRHIALETDSHL